MDPETLRILMAADDADEAGAPAAFDWREEMSKVREMIPVLERITGRSFEVDESVQNASFFTDLGTYDDFRLPAGGTLRLAVLAVRFSSFGKLFTTWSVEQAEGKRASTLSQGVVRKAIEAVQKRCYVHVDAETLRNEPYSGVHPRFRGHSWWIRFFDCV